MKKTLLKKLSGTIMALSIGASAAGYFGAEVYSNEVFRYGRFEARMQMAAASGTVSSMFLYFNDSYMGSATDLTPWREIDIEILGKTPGSFQSNMITGNAITQIMSPAHHDIIPSSDQTYHDYAMEWTPNYVAWFLDGVEVRRNTDQQTIDLQDHDQSLRFNLWSSTTVSWVGSWSDAPLPLHQFITSVRVLAYTPGKGPNGSDFTESWTDDFNDDSGRWGFGDWTFAKNRVFFNPINATIKDGAMVLSITKDAPEAFTGVVPADVPSPVRKTASPTAAVTWGRDGTILHIENAKQGSRLTLVDAKGTIQWSATTGSARSMHVDLRNISHGVLVLKDQERFLGKIVNP